jgi:DNA-binding LacI/PurR family transcriptional regulator
MGDKTVSTIEDIAKLAGVSKSTVSRALNDSPLIGEETRERIHTIARQHNFQMHVAARRLSLQKSRTIVFVTHNLARDFCIFDIFGLEMVGAISNALAANNYDMLMAHVDPYTTTWASQYLDSGRADGFILMTSTRKSFHIKKLLEINAPFIVWGVTPPNQSYCSVTGDNYNGGLLAGRRLLSQGRKKIAFLGGAEGELEVIRRYQGFEAAMLEAGRTVDPDLVVYADYMSEAAAEKTKLLLERAPDLDGIFSNSDVMAIAAMDALRAKGRRIPDDVAVVGYDDLSIAAICNPPLTTISQHLPLAGRMLAENLIQRLQKGVVTNMTVPVTLVERQSA